MATINYNGMELEEFVPEDSCFFDPPKKAVFISEDHIPIREKRLFSFDKRFHSPFTDEDNLCWPHCAILPDPPKPRRATWLEVARWCATGNGLVYDTYRDRIDTGIMFKSFEGDEPIMDKIKVRKWSDTEWHEPDVFYMGLEDK
jgi:hypothetical protein